MVLTEPIVSTIRGGAAGWVRCEFKSGFPRPRRRTALGTAASTAAAMSLVVAAQRPALCVCVYMSRYMPSHAIQAEHTTHLFQLNDSPFQDFHELRAAVQLAIQLEAVVWHNENARG